MYYVLSNFYHSIIQQKQNILLDHVENLIDLLASRNMFINVILQAMKRH